VFLFSKKLFLLISDEASSIAEESIENHASMENIENIEENIEEEAEEITNKKVEIPVFPQAPQPEPETIPMSISSSDDFLPGEFVAPAPQIEEEAEEAPQPEIFHPHFHSLNWNAALILSFDARKRRLCSLFTVCFLVSWIQVL